MRTGSGGNGRPFSQGVLLRPWAACGQAGRGGFSVRQEDTTQAPLELATHPRRTQPALALPKHTTPQRHSVAAQPLCLRGTDRAAGRAISHCFPGPQLKRISPGLEATSDRMGNFCRGGSRAEGQRCPLQTLGSNLVCREG